MESLSHSYKKSLSIFSFEETRTKGSRRGDRFIPTREMRDSKLTNFDTPEKNEKEVNVKSKIPIFTSESPESSNKKRYSKILKHNIVDNKSILSFNSKNRDDSFLSKQFCHVISAIDMDFTITDCLFKRARPLPQRPIKVLDAPEMEDDFYKQLFHWSPVNNKIAVGLSNIIYIWDADEKKASQLCKFFDYEELCSLKWSPNGKQLAFGMDTGEIKIWDITKNQSISSLPSHYDRVSCLDWKNDLVSGSKDKAILISDPRDTSILKTFEAHTKQILNVSEANHNQPYILSGGNDSRAFVFDKRKENSYTMKVVHQGPVRAIGWNTKKKNIFATGGGSTDQMLKLWNLQKQKMVDEVCTNAQICDLIFSENENEIVTALGGDSNKVNFYSEKGLSKIGSLKGHKMRVLNIQFSPDNSQLVSISPDETMRFWEVNDIVRQRSKTEKIEPPKFFSGINMR